MSSPKISRRQALKVIAGAAAGAAVVGAVPIQARAVEAARTFGTARYAPYQGKLVVYSVVDPVRNAPLVKAIEDANAGIKLEWRQLLSEKWVELFSGAELAGDQIDIMDMNGQDLRRYAVGNKLLDLSDLSYKDRFREVGLTTYTVNNKLWALPRGGIGGFTFLFNKAMFDKIGLKSEPETYDDLKKIQPELQKLGAAVFTHPGKNIYLWPVWQFWAYAQTSGNKAIENTFKTLQGDMKFTDPEHVAALEILYKFTQDGMFVSNVNSLDNDGAELSWFQGKGAIWLWGPWEIPNYRKAQSGLKDFEMSLMPPVRAVSDTSVKRQMPGGTGNALSIYGKIAPERVDVAKSVMDLMTSDKWVDWANKDAGDPVSCNKNVQASDDPLALKYAKDCAPLQNVYLDWFWPPEITRAFQEQQQAIVAGTAKPDEAAAAIQKVFDGLVADGYKFQ